MNLVESAALYLNYSPEKIQRITTLLEYSASAYGYGTEEYYHNITNSAYPSDTALIALVTESMFTEYKNVSGSHDYRGVTIYRNPDRTFSCPELGIYSVETSAQMKDMIKAKQPTSKKVEENIELVVDNIFGQYNLTESQFISFVLEDITEELFEEFGGVYFKDFVDSVYTIAGGDANIHKTPTSLINEGYVFDEGFGDFIKNAANKLGDGADRHNAAQAALGKALSNPTKTVSDAHTKVKAALGKTFNKKNMAGVGAVVNAAANGVNKLANNVAKGAEVGVTVFDNINTDALESKRAEVRAKNAEDPKAKLDREAEAAPSSEPPVTGTTKKKKPTSKELEAKYDEVMKESDFMELVKSWLEDSEIFEDETELDNYIMNEMTSEDLELILDNLELDEDYKLSSTEKVSNKNNTKDYEYSNRRAKTDIRKSLTANAAQFEPTRTIKPLGKAIAPPKNRNALVPVPLVKPLGKAIAPPKNRNALVPVPPVKPLGKAIGSPDYINAQRNTNSRVAAQTDIKARQSTNAAQFEPAKKSRRYSNEPRNLKRPAGYMTNKPMPVAEIPQKSVKQKSPDYKGFTSNGKYTALSADNMLGTKLGKYQRTKTKIAQTVAASGQKPSNLVSRSLDNTKNYVSKLLKKFNPLKESIASNWLNETELHDIVCWLVEYGEFQYEQEILEYLNEDMTWDDINTIQQDIEDKSLDILVECFYGYYDNSDEILGCLYEHIGDEYYQYIIEADDEYESENMVSKSSFKNPKKLKNTIVNNPSITESSDCDCSKSSCKTCNTKKWKSKLVSKATGVK